MSSVIIEDKVTGLVIYSSWVPEIVSSAVRFSVHRHLSQTPSLVLFFPVVADVFTKFSLATSSPYYEPDILQHNSIA